MARIEWIKLRLNNWALWKVREASGGLGWATQSSFLNDFNACSSRESRVPVDEVDASVTDQAVESLKVTHQHLYETLQLIYPLGIGVRESARRIGIGESSVRARLDHADAVLRDWFNARAERKMSSTP